MVNHGTNGLGIDKSKTAGGRRRRKAANRKDRLRRQNLYVVKIKRVGVYKDGSEWVTTIMDGKRTREKLVSDRRGGTTTETVEDVESTSDDPVDGLEIERFDTKKEATSELYTPDSWTMVGSGKYVGDGALHREVDRDEWAEWIRSRHVRRKQ